MPSTLIIAQVMQAWCQRSCVGRVARCHRGAHSSDVKQRTLALLEPIQSMQAEERQNVWLYYTTASPQCSSFSSPGLAWLTKSQAEERRLCEPGNASKPPRRPEKETASTEPQTEYDVSPASHLLELLRELPRTTDGADSPFAYPLPVERAIRIPSRESTHVRFPIESTTAPAAQYVQVGPPRHYFYFQWPPA